MKNTLIHKEVHAAAVMKRVILPTFFEFLILFAVPITDTLFLTHVDKNLISVFAIFSTLATIAVLHAQNFSNLSVGELHAKETISDSYLYILAGAIGIAFFYISIYTLCANTILLFGGIRIITDGMRVYFMLMILSLIFTCARKVPVAYDIVTKNAKKNVYCSTILFVLNLCFNAITWYLYTSYGLSEYFFSCGIGAATVLSHCVTLFIHTLSQRTQCKITRISKHTCIQLCKKLYIASLSNLESLSYAVMLYIFLGTLAHGDDKLYLTRNTLAPFFLLVTAATIAWSLNANRVSFIIQKNPTYDMSFRIHALYKVSVKNAWGSCLILGIIIGIVLPIMITITSKDIIIATVAMLFILEFFRSININTNTLLRSLHFIKYSVVVSVCSNIGLIVVMVFLKMRFSPHPLQRNGAILMTLFIGEEVFRTTINYFLLLWKLKIMRKSLST